MHTLKLFLAAVFLAVVAPSAWAIERPNMVYKIFQSPADKIPRIDGDTEDWDIVPEDYVIGTDPLSETVNGHGTKIHPKDLDVRVEIRRKVVLNE